MEALKPPPIIGLHGFLGLPQDLFFLRELDSTLHLPDYFNDVNLSPKNLWSEWGKNFWQQQKNTEPVILVGYSLGGRLALNAFAVAPERVQALILISSGILPPPSNEAAVREAQDKKWAASFLNEEWSSVLARWNAQSVFKNSFEPRREEPNYKRENLALALANWSSVKMIDHRDLLAQHRERVLCLAGERDKKYCEQFLELKNQGVIANLEIIKEAGHRLIFDQPQAVSESIRKIIF